MDLDQVKTFLAVAETGSFVSASEQLNITQSTVSARIKNLEYFFGQPLFTRSRSGAETTPAGEKFKWHAATLVRVWDHARLEGGLPEDFQALLKIGAQYSLWEDILLEWSCSMRMNHPLIAMRTEGGSSETLNRQLGDGLLDLAVLYTPQARPGITFEILLHDSLIAVTSDLNGPKVGGPGYIFVEWGDHFGVSHAEAFPDIEVSGFTDAMGPLALQIILRTGGCGFFPERMTAPYVNDGSLFVVPGAPSFERPVYVAYSEDADNGALETALTQLKSTASNLLGSVRR
ncbi:MAG: LysR family transcriptional regulator [Proteobacteria bacterium]|nr:LysR family transcriptional regulator [Pseudomonadota bacterium]